MALRMLLCLLILGSCGKNCSKAAELPAHERALVTQFAGVSLESLNSEQRMKFVQLLNDEICPCGCPMTFAQCLQKEETCKPATLLANWIIDRLKEDVPMELMAPGLSKEINSGFSAAPQIIDLAAYASKGSSSAPYTLVEFADFECVHCKQTAQFVEQFISAHPEVRFVYKHFPLPGHELAKQGAIAAEAAAEQGKFWDMHHALFGSIRPLTDNQIDSLAKKFKLNMPRFKADLSKPEVAQRVENSLKEGQLLGIAGTPAMYFNGRPYFLSTDRLGLELRLAMEKARSEATCQ